MVRGDLVSAERAKSATYAATKAAGKVARAVQRNVKSAVAGTLGLGRKRMTKVDTAWLRTGFDADEWLIIGVLHVWPPA